MNESEIRASLRAFLAKHIRSQELRDDEDVFATGYVNSMFAMQLVQFVESTFGFTVGDDDLSIDNFRSVDTITALVVRHLAAVKA